MLCDGVLFRMHLERTSLAGVERGPTYETRVCSAGVSADMFTDILDGIHVLV
jgi:hypothetical protein